MNKKSDKLQFVFTRGCAGWKRGVVSVIAVPDDDAYGPYYPFARYCWYIHDDAPGERWGDARLDMCVHDVTHFKRSDVEYRCSCTISAEGEVVFLEDPQDKHEKIPGAGIESPDSKFWGRIYGMSVVGTHLYAYGEGRQIYRRSDSGQWKCMDSRLLLGADVPLEEDRIVYCGRGPSEDAIYFVDSCGSILFWNGELFSELCQLNGIRLIDIHVESQEKIWISGSDSTLLCGNHRDGFFQVAGVHGEHNFSSLTQYDGKIYLASHGGGWDDGPWVYDGEQLQRVKTGLVPENLDDAHTVDAANGDLWFIGLRDILRFDGENWERIDFPGNTPIR